MENLNNNKTIYLLLSFVWFFFGRINLSFSLFKGFGRSIDEFIMYLKSFVLDIEIRI